MNAWPSALPPPDWGTEEEAYLPQAKSEFEANYIQVYPTASRLRQRWPLKWGLLSETDYQALLTFFAANQGCMFTWTHPIAASSHVCVFSGDSIKSTPHAPGWRRNVQCHIEEV